MLLDEIEKAQSMYLQILLQVMDPQVQEVPNGKEADAKNCVLIPTSNLGAKESDTNALGFDSLEKETYEDGAFKNFLGFQNLEIDLTVLLHLVN